MANLIPYQAKNGDMIDFDISPEATARFGEVFTFGTRVNTPRGHATVIGISDKFLWFHIDGDKGASYWDNVKGYEDLVQNGFTLVDSEMPPPLIHETVNEYKLKRIFLGKGAKSIILQAENGPCPLIAMCNILVLRGLIDLESKDNKITAEKMVQKLQDYLKNALSEEQFKTNEDIIKNISKFKVGLDVNCAFTGCEAFEQSENMKIFELLKMRALHGWLVDAQTKVFSPISP